MTKSRVIEVPSGNQINKSGKFLRDRDLGVADLSPEGMRRTAEARAVVQKFRDAHAYPMVLVRGGLVSFLNTADAYGAVGQRHKRVPRIIRKLRRMRDGASGGTGLSRLEDIGGCRVVLDTPTDLALLEKKIRKRWSGQFMRDPRDYIELPKPMGYRAVHIVVRREGRAIEIQLRTRGQQEWADAVEAADSRMGGKEINLKDEVGPPELLDYFRTAGEMIYRREFGIPVDVAMTDEFEDARTAVIAAGHYSG